MHLRDILKRNFPIITPEYEAFAMSKDQCRKCSLFDHYKQVVQSEGNAKNPIFMFIGEAPGNDEKEQCRPFIGRAGQALRQQLRKYPKVFRRDTVLLSNILACRPLNNAFPTLITEYGQKWKGYEISPLQGENKEVQTCSDSWLKKEIELVSPKIIIALGSHALRIIRGQNGITNNRGKWKFLYPYKAWSFATYHPSYAMRCKNSDKNHIFIQFQQDIGDLAVTYPTMLSDARYNINHEQYKRQTAIEAATQLGLIGHNDDPPEPFVYKQLSKEELDKLDIPF